MSIGKKFIKLSLYFLSVTLVFLLLIIFIFSSNDTQVDYDIPQNIGGVLSLKGIEKDHFEFCEYDISLSYQPKNSGMNYEIGTISGVIEDISICEKMGLYKKLSIYSSLQLVYSKGQYKLVFKDGVNTEQVFTSNNLKVW